MREELKGYRETWPEYMARVRCPDGRILDENPTDLANVRESDRPSVPTGIEAVVCGDIADRQRLGIAKYGTTVADNPLTLREWLMHAYQESLDYPIYLRRAIAEVDAMLEAYRDLARAVLLAHFAQGGVDGCRCGLCERARELLPGDDQSSVGTA